MTPSILKKAELFHKLAQTATLTDTKAIWVLRAMSEFFIMLMGVANDAMRRGEITAQEFKAIDEAYEYAMTIKNASKITWDLALNARRVYSMFCRDVAPNILAVRNDRTNLATSTVIDAATKSKFKNFLSACNQQLSLVPSSQPVETLPKA